MPETTAHVATWKTDLTLSVRAPHDLRLQRWLDALLRDEVAALDLLASRFRPDSELSAVNRGAGGFVDVSWDFVGVLTASLSAAAATDGLVDPLLGRQVVAAGYDVWAGQESGITPGRTACDWADIEIRGGRSGAQVRIPADAALDLGAVAKGWLADRLAVIAHTSTGLDALANMGGDLRVISPGQPWVVAADPDLPGVEPVSLEVEDSGLATSGLGHRAWRGGHHIIDPRTGAPADTPWSSVSVLAADAAGANTAATAAMVSGTDGPEWIGRAGLDAWFVAAHGASVPVGRWPHVPDFAPAGA